MPLSTHMKEGGLAEIATATPATAATVGTELIVVVAGVATVAVADALSAASDAQTGSAELTPDEESENRAWFASIEKHDESTIADILDKCRVDMDARAYFLARALEGQLPAPPAGPVPCGSCRHLQRTGHQHLGHWARGEPEDAAGLWDTDRRVCTSHLPTLEAETIAGPGAMRD
jgi:hypothetical protein